METCSEWGGEVKIIASIEDPVVIRKILVHLVEKATCAMAGLLPQCRAPPRMGLLIVRAMMPTMADITLKKDYRIP